MSSTNRYAHFSLRHSHADHLSIDEACWQARTGALFVIADGAAPEAASTVAGSLVAPEIHARYYADPAANRVEALQAAFYQAHRRLRAQDPGARAAGVAVLLWGDFVIAVNAGATRVYLLDAFEGFESLACGSLPGALGAAHGLTLETWAYTRDHHRFVLLCSDGLYQRVAEADIEAALLAGENPADVIRLLLSRLVVSDGAGDVTVAVIELGPRKGSRAPTPPAGTTLQITPPTPSQSESQAGAVSAS